jgi:hypothetical protein
MLQYQFEESEDLEFQNCSGTLPGRTFKRRCFSGCGVDVICGVL